MFILKLYRDFVGKYNLSICFILSVVTIAIFSTSLAIGDTLLGEDDFGATTALAGIINVEAEDLERTHFLIEKNEFASGGKLISLRNAGGNNGVASGTFRGNDGKYFVVINYVDEEDGIAELGFSINGRSIERWSLNKHLGADGAVKKAFTARTLSGFLNLKRGDNYSIQGEKDNNEETRVDLIQFIPLAGIHQAEFASFASLGGKVQSTEKAKLIPSELLDANPIIPTFEQPLTFPEDIIFSPTTPIFEVSSEQNDIPGFTSRGYVNPIFGGAIEWSVNISDNSTAVGQFDYSLGFRYSYGAPSPETRPLDVYVNDKLAASGVPFKSTGVDSRWLNQTVIVRLNKGINTIRIEIASQGDKMANIDFLSVSKVKYLNARGSVIPEPSAYHPESGESGYLESYYGRVDPQGKRTTLNDWKRENGFNTLFHTEASAEYINGADLGFGRKMHCLNNDQVSCYVENFLNPGTDKEQFAATVTMERMRVRDKQIVAFFVYDKNGKRINQLGLDSEGAKAVPQSCYACHGGSSHAGSPQEGSRYIPWDIELLKDWEGHPTVASQERGFQELNRIAWRDVVFRKKPEIKTLIESWYDGTPNAGAVFSINDHFNTLTDGSLIPKDASKASWFTDPKGYLDFVNDDIRNRYYRERSLYENVYTKYCRSCHVAQKIDWDDAVSFNQVAYQQICGDERQRDIMPHAELTDDLFSNQRVTFVHGETSTALEILCSEPPIKRDITAEQVSAGRDLFRSKVDNTGKAGGCVRCHSSDDSPRNNPAEQVATDLSCKVSVKNDLNSINSVMNFSLSNDEVKQLTAYLSSFDQCNN